MIISPQEAIQRLQEGNRRYVADRKTHSINSSPATRRDLADGQEPFAIILGCSDSRVPPEVIFDQGLGDLFIVRVAGNVAGPTQVGSIEFALQELGTRLIVVLGHSMCGAVTATLEDLLLSNDNPSKNLGSIVELVRPAIKDLVESDLRNNPVKLMNEAVRANIQAAINQLLVGSYIIPQMVHDEGVTIVGAEYTLDSGVVEFLDIVSE